MMMMSFFVVMLMLSCQTETSVESNQETFGSTVIRIQGQRNNRSLSTMCKRLDDMITKHQLGLCVPRKILLGQQNPPISEIVTVWNVTENETTALLEILENITVHYEHLFFQNVTFRMYTELTLDFENILTTVEFIGELEDYAVNADGDEAEIDIQRIKETFCYTVLSFNRKYLHQGALMECQMTELNVSGWIWGSVTFDTSNSNRARNVKFITELIDLLSLSFGQAEFDFKEQASSEPHPEPKMESIPLNGFCTDITAKPKHRYFLYNRIEDSDFCYLIPDIVVENEDFWCLTSTGFTDAYVNTTIGNVTRYFEIVKEFRNKLENDNCTKWNKWISVGHRPEFPKNQLAPHVLIIGGSGINRDDCSQISATLTNFKTYCYSRTSGRHNHELVTLWTEIPKISFYEIPDIIKNATFSELKFVPKPNLYTNQTTINLEVDISDKHWRDSFWDSDKSDLNEYVANISNKIESYIPNGIACGNVSGSTITPFYPFKNMALRFVFCTIPGTFSQMLAITKRLEDFLHVERGFRRVYNIDVESPIERIVRNVSFQHYEVDGRKWLGLYLKALYPENSYSILHLEHKMEEQNGMKNFHYHGTVELANFDGSDDMLRRWLEQATVETVGDL